MYVYTRQARGFERDCTDTEGIESSSCNTF